MGTFVAARGDRVTRSVHVPPSAWTASSFLDFTGRVTRPPRPVGVVGARTKEVEIGSIVRPIEGRTMLSCRHREENGTAHPDSRAGAASPSEERRHEVTPRASRRVSGTRPRVSDTRPLMSDTRPLVRDTRPPVSGSRPPHSASNRRPFSVRRFHSGSNRRLSDTRPRVPETRRLDSTSNRRPILGRRLHLESNRRVPETRPRVSETRPRVSETRSRVSETRPRVSETRPRVSKTRSRGASGFLCVRREGAAGS